MNCLSNLPDLAIYVLQQQNITKKINKIPDISTKAVPNPENEEEIIRSDETPLDGIPLNSIPLDKELEVKPDNIKFTLDDK